MPRSVFNPEYPERPKTFGQALRKARIDTSLLIKELAHELGVSQDTVINWEIRGMKPAARNLRKVLERFPELERWV